MSNTVPRNPSESHDALSLDTDGETTVVLAEGVRPDNAFICFEDARPDDPACSYVHVTVDHHFDSSTACRAAEFAAMQRLLASCVLILRQSIDSDCYRTRGRAGSAELRVDVLKSVQFAPSSEAVAKYIVELLADYKSPTGSFARPTNGATMFQRSRLSMSSYGGMSLSYYAKNGRPSRSAHGARMAISEILWRLKIDILALHELPNLDWHEAMKSDLTERGEYWLCLPGDELKSALSGADGSLQNSIAMEATSEESASEESISHSRKTRDDEDVPALLLKLHKQKSVQRGGVDLRPTRLADIVGQDDALDSLFAKLASKNPQHVILYGPPGVGKTSAARAVFDAVKKSGFSGFGADAPFIEVDGATAWRDERYSIDSILGGFVEPSYENSLSEPFRKWHVTEPRLGPASLAHGGILFIDEIGELSNRHLSVLLKVLEDGVIRPGMLFDAEDARRRGVPETVVDLLENGIPTSFTLVAATTADPADINPAIRSRCAKVVFDPLAHEHVERIATDAADKLGSPMAHEDCARLVADYAADGRRAVQIVRDAVSRATIRRRADKLRMIDVEDAIHAQRIPKVDHNTASPHSLVGKVHGLGVRGHEGTTLLIEAVACRARRGEGALRFNETPGSMMQDSLHNALGAIRSMTKLEPRDWDIHVNVVGGGKVDGPSAGVACAMAAWSAITQTPLPQDVAVTGEISLDGRTKPVGGTHEKRLGALRAGFRRVVVPHENAAPFAANDDVYGAEDLRHAVSAMGVNVKWPRGSWRYGVGHVRNYGAKPAVVGQFGRMRNQRVPLHCEFAHVNLDEFGLAVPERHWASDGDLS